MGSVSSTSEREKIPQGVAPPPCMVISPHQSLIQLRRIEALMDSFKIEMPNQPEGNEYRAGSWASCENGYYSGLCYKTCPNGYKRTDSCSCSHSYSDRTHQNHTQDNCSQSAKVSRKPAKTCVDVEDDIDDYSSDESRVEGDSSDDGDLLESEEEEPVVQNKLHINVPVMLKENNSSGKLSECILCYDNVGDIVLNCGHLGFCASCIDKIVSPFNNNNNLARPLCPVCQSMIQTATRVFVP